LLGSGTTLIAAALLGRCCFGMEIEPACCDVIVRRYIALAGEQAVPLDMRERYRVVTPSVEQGISPDGQDLLIPTNPEPKDHLITAFGHAYHWHQLLRRNSNLTIITLAAQETIGHLGVYLRANGGKTQTSRDA